ncbi:hypothetical protein ACD591_01910 [Rufibacter glacialis]|uniref:Uncharacterized protein n=1 Tax=Rufibacter glacialis TaxID=1259555 RepID=A0A5M8QHT0_9BACT|nr:hypothetical protein [Rufibacter glacialis]KAA6435647.1 hypothetical protein FOE74_06810 [Rufibacter glacialis]GGK65233.1 hypothetical protein GCM10011405_11580 [Rufibacter glacialis]
MLKIFWVAVLAFLFSCQSSPSEETTTSSSAKTSASQKNGKTKPMVKLPVQHIVQRTHPFSSDQAPDYFRLALHGHSIAKGEVEFTITTQDGQEIYEENFPAADLEASMVNEVPSPTTPTVSEREAYILKRMDEFVQPTDFVAPAIAPNAPVQASFVNETTWKRIQANPKAIGFKYLLGKEDGRLLVYDPEKKKAVRYGSFGG